MHVNKAICAEVLSVILWVLLFAMLHFSFSQLKSVLTIYYKQKHVIAFTRHMTRIKNSVKIFLKDTHSDMFKVFFEYIMSS